MIHESGPPLRVSSLLSKDWLADLSQIDWLIDYLNEVRVVEWTLVESSPTGEAYRSEFQQNHKMTASEVVEISRYILGALQKKQPQNLRNVVIGKLFHWRPGQEDTVLPVTGISYTTDNSQKILCDIHKGLLMVEPEGIVPFCTLFKSRFPMTIGSLRSEPLSVLWEKLCQIRIDHAIPKRTLCSGCGLLKYCGGGCPGEDPGADSTNFLTTCDFSSKTRIPLVQSDYDHAFSLSQVN
jgi:radical SAM protein with 4Fe4S-binding SPASM domain